MKILLLFLDKIFVKKLQLKVLSLGRISVLIFLSNSSDFDPNFKFQHDDRV